MIDKSEIPDNTKVADGRPDSKGTIMIEYRTCGDKSYHCMNDGEKHGPDRYRIYHEGGDVKMYLGKADDGG